MSADRGKRIAGIAQDAANAAEEVVLLEVADLLTETSERYREIDEELRRDITRERQVELLDEAEELETQLFEEIMVATVAAIKGEGV